MPGNYFSKVLVIIVFLAHYSSPGICQTFTVNDGLNIGLLVMADTLTDLPSRDLARAAQLAVERRNVQGGVNGKKINLIVKSCDGRWGAGSKQSVDLIYEHEVKVLIGAVGGQNAHLAEQVATKAQVVFLSSQATDHTLSQINIPWFFRGGMSDTQISEALFDELFDNPKSNTEIVVVFQKGYDNEMAKDTFFKLLAEKNVRSPDSFLMDDYLQTSMANEKRAVVFFGNSEEIKKVFDKTSPHLLYSFDGKGINHNDFEDEKTMIPVFSNWSESSFRSFRSDYLDRYHSIPSLNLSYTYDVINLVLQALKAENSSGGSLRNYLSNVDFTGITGTISFDGSGNRTGAVKFISISSIY